MEGSRFFPFQENFNYFTIISALYFRKKFFWTGRGGGGGGLLPQIITQEAKAVF